MTKRISIIVPVYNDAKNLAECVSALNASAGADTEIIVVDDASTDDTAAAARAMGVRVLDMPKNGGPGAARNYGAAQVQGDIVFFVDADVVVASDALGRVRRAFEDDPKLGAVFGSYDDSPRAPGVVSQYRNLLHHFTHQQARTEASTFWAGCGAVRRSVFEAVNGFDGTRFARPSIEDIDLGVRMRQAGYRILLDRRMQGTHLKRWDLRSMIWTDVTRRAAPWARLVLENKDLPNDLNLKRGQRVSVALVGLLCVVLPLAIVWAKLLVVAAAAVTLVLVINRDLFAFFLRRRGAFFALACVPLHLLFFLYSGLTFLVVLIGMRVKRPFRANRALAGGAR